MKREISWPLVLGALGIALVVAGPVEAQNRNCGSRTMILSQLEEKYREAPIAQGLAPGGHLVEMFGAGPGGTWTVTITAPNGMMCLLTSGTDLEVLELPAQGDPV